MVEPPGRSTLKVSSTATGEVLTTSATVPPTVIPVPSVNTYGSARVPLPRLPEKVAATPEEVMSRAPFQWCDASTVTADPRLRVRSATAMRTSGVNVGPGPTRRSMTMLPPRVWPAIEIDTPVAATRKPGFRVTLSGTVIGWSVVVVLNRTLKLPVMLIAGTSSCRSAATWP